MDLYADFILNKSVERQVKMRTVMLMTSAQFSYWHSILFMQCAINAVVKYLSCSFVMVLIIILLVCVYTICAQNNEETVLHLSM